MPSPPDEVQGVGPVVLEGIAQAVRFPFRLPVRVGNPARHPGCGVKPLEVDVHALGDAPAPVDRVDGDLGGRGNAPFERCREVVGGDPRESFGVGLQPADE